MAYCENCGAPLGENVKFCGQCGAGEYRDENEKVL